MISCVSLQQLCPAHDVARWVAQCGAVTVQFLFEDDSPIRCMWFNADKFQSDDEGASPHVFPNVQLIHVACHVSCRIMRCNMDSNRSDRSRPWLLL